MRRFFDTNILVYSRDPENRTKREVARALIAEAIEAEAFVLSTQVLVEFYSTVVRRKFLAPQEALDLVRFWSDHDTVPHTLDLVVRGLQLHQSHFLAIWDGLIVQAAIDAQCDVLFTEDMQHGRRFGDLEIFNPFLSAADAHEPVRNRYRARAGKTKRSAARP